jgi:hypothetical protein
MKVAHYPALLNVDSQPAQSKPGARFWTSGRLTGNWHLSQLLQDWPYPHTIARETLANHVRFASYASACTQMGLRKLMLINGVYARSRCLGEALISTTIVRRD